MKALVFALATGICIVATTVVAQEDAIQQLSQAPEDATCDAESDITTIVSRYSIEETVQRLKASLNISGLSVVTIAGQDAAGNENGAPPRHREMLVIGDPHTRRLLLTMAPLVALDLPTKMLVWEDGKPVKVSFKDAQCLRQRYDLTPRAVEYFDRIEEAAERALR